MKDYCSLHNHTCYSLMDSIIKPEQLFIRAKELNQSSIAITDHGTLLAAHDGLLYSKKHDVKLIIGCEFYFAHNFNSDSRLSHIILIARNYEGYKNLLLANKLANDNSIIMFNKVIPRINWDIIKQCSNGLICSTACGNGILSQLINTRQAKEAKKIAKQLKDIFGDYLALEIQPNALKRIESNFNEYEDQSLVNNTLIRMGKELNIKVIAATNAHYLTKEQWTAHDVWLAIGNRMPIHAQSRLRYTVNDFYIKSREEVINFFSRLYSNQAEEFCDNTLYFSNLCEQPDWISPRYSNTTGFELPEFNVKHQEDYNEFQNWLDNNPECKPKKEQSAYLKYICAKNLYKVPQHKIEEYTYRLNEELAVIESLNFDSYMLIVGDYINFCNKNGIAIGPGRGSVGGCLVAYLQGIHKADPIKYGLIFSRFINKYKKSLPDIDSDFSSKDREKVREYLRNKYGGDNVALISNINTLTPKVYARDISRTFQFGGTQKRAVAIGNNIADSIPKDITSLKDALENAPLFMEYANSPKYEALKLYAKDLDGLPKAWSTHAAGCVIGKRPLVECIPLRRDKDKNIVLEYEKKRAETDGFVKMDLLAVSVLDIIDNTIEIAKNNNKIINRKDIEDYDKEYKEIYDLISSGDTLGVFQLGKSDGAVDLCKKMKPKSIEDLAMLTAIIRPNTVDIRKKFFHIRDSKQSVELLHPNLARAFAATYGFAIFEECLMWVANDIAGWDLHNADRLRKLTKDKGKSSKDIIKTWRKEFIQGGVENNIDKNTVTRIWDEIVAKFQGYAFNKAHAIAYSFLSYQTAYLKTYYPLEFLTARLMFEINSNAQQSKDNVIQIKNEIRKRKVKILPPHINKSHRAYSIIDDNTLITGFDSLNYLSNDGITKILENRPFNSLTEFVSKTKSREITSRSIQSLAASGCLDNFGLTRKQMFLYAGDFKKKLRVWESKKIDKEFQYPWPDNIGEWSLQEKYAMELEYLGEGLCCGMVQAYPNFFTNKAINFSTLSELFPEEKTTYNVSLDEFGSVQGVIVDYFEWKIKKEDSKYVGQIMAKIKLQDPYDNNIIMTVFPKSLQFFNKRIKMLSANKIKLEPGIAVHCAASINWYDGGISLIFNDLYRVAPIPPKPQDLDPKQVSMQITSRKIKKTNQINAQEVLTLIENEMIEEGI